MIKVYKNFHYYCYIPNNFNPEGGNALHITMHGAGTRGTDREVLSNGVLTGQLERGLELPCVVVAPQCEAETWFDVFEQLQDFIGGMIEEYKVDPAKVYLSGNSMGGYCCWQLLITMPKTFARALICCGGGMYWNAGIIKTPVRAFHGALDRVVFVEESIKMCNAVNRSDGTAELTVYYDLEHDCWTRAFNNPDNLKWISGQ